MKVIHNFENCRIENESNPIGFMLTNSIGGYALFSDQNSRYFGFFSYFDDMYKTIADIKNAEKITELCNYGYCVKRKRETFTESFFIPKGKNALVYETTKDVKVELLFDIKKSFDNRNFGRFHSIVEENGFLILRYIKETHANEDNSQGKKEYEINIAIKCTGIEYIKQWQIQKYDLDQKRNSTPIERYVFNAFACNGKSIIISVATNKEQAKQELKSVLDNIQNLQQKQKNEFKLINKNTFETSFALTCVSTSIEGLVNTVQNNKGIYAGLPRFFQYWTRDEAISSHEVTLGKELLLRQLSLLLPDGRLPNIRLHTYQGQPLPSADSIGWCFFRLSKMKLASDEKQFITKQIIQSLELIQKKYQQNGLIMSGNHETWMDTGKDDERLGARIEIQALTLAMYKFAYDITKDGKYKHTENELKDIVRKQLFNGKILFDGYNDETIRPNIFIAAYVYPELLTNDEWIKVIENSLDALWLPWGGISTIDKKNKLFIDTHTGEDPTSYHRGDSWFFMNNIAAMVMYQTDKKKFNEYIKKIYEASTKEILWMGLIGHHAELSSAKALMSEGSLCQAWSNATYIEMVNRLF